MPALPHPDALGASKHAGRRRLGQTVATALAIASIHVLLAAASAQEKPQRLPTLVLTAGMHRIQAEVALTPEQRAIGLMHRSSLGTHEGMLFVFDSPSQQCFWMKNTLIPLAIAFVDDEGRVVNIEEMKAQSLDSHCSARPVRFALEMNAGWFSKRGIGPGFRLSGTPFKTGAAAP